MAHRRLAAIMFTDIVGYTSLMGRDLEKALELLRRNREIQIPLIKKHGGKWLKEMGDGTLAQFDSAIDSVLCAEEIQKMARSKLGAKLRIGIHLGDVTIENEDVFGDGVNIASRLQSIADPGAIYISESIYEAIRARKDIHCEILGDIQLKNVDHLVKTYYLRKKGLPIPSAAKIKNLIRRSLTARVFGSVYTYIILLLLVSIGWWIRKEFFVEKLAIPSVMFFPIDNYIGSDTLDYLFAGMHDALIGEAGKISAWQVKSKTTANAYRNVEKSITEIASEINIDAAIETSVSCIGEEMCFQVALVDARDDKQLWIKDYSVERSQIPNLFRTLAKEISNEIGVMLTPEEKQMLSQSITVDPEAYDAYLRGMYCVENGTKADLDHAMEYFQLALKIDSTYALAYSGIASAWVTYHQHGFLPRSITEPKWEEAARKALELDSTLVEVQGRFVVHETYNTIYRGEWEDIDRRFRKIIEINPNSEVNLVFYGHFLGVVGRPNEGLIYSYRAIEIDPFNEFIQAVHAVNLKNARKYDEAFQVLQGLFNTNPNNIIGLPTIWAVYHEEGQYTEALNVAEKIYTIKGNDAAKEAMESGYAEGGYRMAMQRTAEKMIAHRDTAYFPSWQISTLYARADLKNEALDWLWKAYEEHDANVIVIGVDPLFDFLREEPPFKELLGKMNLPAD